MNHQRIREAHPSRVRRVRRCSVLLAALFAASAWVVPAGRFSEPRPILVLVDWSASHVQNPVRALQLARETVRNIALARGDSPVTAVILGRPPKLWIQAKSLREWEAHSGAPPSSPSGHRGGEASLVAGALALGLQVLAPRVPSILLLGDLRTSTIDWEEARSLAHRRGADWMDPTTLEPPNELLFARWLPPVHALEAGRRQSVSMEIVGDITRSQRVLGRAPGLDLDVVVNPGIPTRVDWSVTPELLASEWRVELSSGSGAVVTTPVLRLPIRGSSRRLVLVAGRDRGRVVSDLRIRSDLEMRELGEDFPTASVWTQADRLIVANAPLPMGGLVDSPIVVSGTRPRRVWVFGGNQAFGGGGYASSSLDVDLPLRSGQDGGRDLLVALDASGSMEQGKRFERAGRAILLLMTKLRPEDRCAFLRLGGSDRSAVTPLLPPVEAAREVEAELRGIPRGPTRLSDLRSAAIWGEGEPASDRKRVLMVISDFDDPGLAIPEDVKQTVAWIQARNCEAWAVLLDPEPKTEALAQSVGFRVVPAPAGVSVDLLLRSTGRAHREEPVVGVWAPRAPGEGRLGVGWRCSTHLASGAVAHLGAEGGEVLTAGWRRGTTEIMASSFPWGVEPAHAAVVADWLSAPLSEGTEFFSFAETRQGVALLGPTEPLALEVIQAGVRVDLQVVAPGEYRATGPLDPWTSASVILEGGSSVPVEAIGSDAEFCSAQSLDPAARKITPEPGSRPGLWNLLAAAVWLAAWAVLWHRPPAPRPPPP